MVLQPSLSWRYIICAGFELRTALLVQEFDFEGKGNTFVDRWRQEDKEVKVILGHI